jgi:hypothetical protein
MGATDEAPTPEPAHLQDEVERSAPGGKHRSTRPEPKVEPQLENGPVEVQGEGGTAEASSVDVRPQVPMTVIEEDVSTQEVPESNGQAEPAPRKRWGLFRRGRNGGDR